MDFQKDALCFCNENQGYGYYPTHPGDILKEEFEYRKLSQKKFAATTGVPYTMLNDILNARRPVSVDFALTIEAALGINAEMLVNMQTRYNMQIARQDREKVERWEKLRQACASLSERPICQGLQNSNNLLMDRACPRRVAGDLVFWSVIRNFVV